MEYKVEMLRFHGPDRFRTVIVESPAENNEELLDQIFQWGQNDFQPVRGFCSLSVGDVIHLNDEKHLIGMTGFMKLDEQEYQHLRERSKQSLS